MIVAIDSNSSQFNPMGVSLRRHQIMVVHFTCFDVQCSIFTLLNQIFNGKRMFELKWRIDGNVACVQIIYNLPNKFMQTVLKLCDRRRAEMGDKRKQFSTKKINNNQKASFAHNTQRVIGLHELF